MTDGLRSLTFKERDFSRYWWFKDNGHVPPVFAMLTAEEWQCVAAWYDATDSRRSAGEANIPCLSVLSGFLEGSGIPNIVQLGHFEGFSTLLLGFMMRRMGFHRAVFSVDVDPVVSEFTESWIRRAGLDDYVKIVVDSSDAPHLPDMAREYLGTDVAAMFIDSAHSYRHALRELDLWWPHLRPLGLIFMHDVSKYAAIFDAEGEGGVSRAVNEWVVGRPVSHLLINEQVETDDSGPAPVYIDGCGLGILQKRRR